MSQALFHLDFPFHLRNGIEARADDAVYVEQLIEMVLFTVKGERVNLPDFGCGIQQLVFQSVDSALVPATLFLVKSELQRYVTQYAVIQDVAVVDFGPELVIEVSYSLVGSPEQRIARYGAGAR